MRNVIRTLYLAFVLAFAGLALPAAVHAQPQIDVNVGFQCRSIGVEQVSVGAAWTDVIFSDYDAITPNAPAAASILVSVTVTNTHASQVLYVLLKTGGAVAVTAAVPVPAGKSVSLPGLMGTTATIVAVQGSGAATTGAIITYWR